MADTIEVCCIATPDGRTFWCEPDQGLIARVWADWKASLSEQQRALYDESGCLGGVVKIRMLRGDFKARMPDGVEAKP